MRRLESELLMLRAVCDLLGLIGIDVRVVEESGQKLFAQHSRDCLVDGGLGDASLSYLFRQIAKSVSAGEFDVDTGVERHLGSLVVGGGDMVQRAQIGNGKVV